MRKFLEFAIEKSALNHTLLLLTLILSIFAYQSVPKEIFPPVELNKILIRGGYPGASAQTLDQMVVSNLEDGLKGIEDLGDIDAIIKNGRFTIVADVREGAEPLLVLNDVKDRISLIRKDLPADMDEPVATLLKRSFPLVLIAIAGQGEGGEREELKLLELAQQLKRELLDMGELSSVDIRGYREEELEIELDKGRIEAYGLHLLDVVEAVKQISTIFPIGSIEERGNHLFITTQNGRKREEEIADTVLKIGGNSVRLGEIASVHFTLSRPETLSHFNGRPTLSLNVTKTKEGNAIELVRQIKELLADYEERYPGYTFKIYTDTSVWIRNRLNTVTSNLFFGLILVFTALLLTVDWRIALVVGMGIPVSFMVGLISLEVLGYSLNMLSLFGALIALGMLVDEAIVVAENIYRHLEMGEDPKSAAINGAAEMFPAVLTATATTIFAFLPLIIISGEMGSFIRILPIVISILLLSSLFEAFYFLPLHAKDLLRVAKGGERGRAIWQRVAGAYGWFLSLLLRAPRLWSLLLVGGIVVGTLLLARESKFQLFPSFDTTQIYIAGRVDVNSKIEETQRLVERVEEALLKSVRPDEVKSITAIVGMKMDAKNNADISPNNFHIFINLHEPKPENFVDRYITPLFSIEYDGSDMVRSRRAAEIARDIERVVAPFRKPPFQEIAVIVPQAGIVKSDIEISLIYRDEERVLEAIKMVEEAMERIQGVSNITDDAREGEREVKLFINRYGESLGITEGYLATYLKPLYLDAEFGKMFKGGELLYIRIQDRERDDFQRFKGLRIDLPDRSGTVPLSQVADLHILHHFHEIIKENGEKIRTIYGSLDKRRLTSREFYQQIAPVLERVRAMGIGVKIKGEERENRKLIREISRAFTIALFLIFASLVLMFNSLLDSLIVLSVIPLSLFGVLLGNKIMGLHITMPGMLGVVGLAGVVVNDGLIMVDFIRRARNRREVVERAKLRVRPILLTSITTILGLSTLIFFASGQSLILQPMAVTLGFGIGWATLINLFIVPLLYVALKRK
ncbi:MAG: efflux RND transporter permease subunit [Epsilonproteobacteria bacterium]|nr:AcrB/AcrD/AcrF family protein [Campylobacterota bacterium]NPA56545.1 efflux RND transporter permease subunit [Campylobacterota bacterium]